MSLLHHHRTEAALQMVASTIVTIFGAKTVVDFSIKAGYFAPVNGMFAANFQCPTLVQAFLIAHCLWTGILGLL